MHYYCSIIVTDASHNCSWGGASWTILYTVGHIQNQIALHMNKAGSKAILSKVHISPESRLAFFQEVQVFGIFSHLQLQYVLNPNAHPNPSLDHNLKPEI